MPHLLAVDVGLRTGLALYDSQGRLVWYRSRNLGTVSRLRQAVPRILGEVEELAWVVAEGSRQLCEIWFHGAERRGARVLSIPAERWRGKLLLGREQRSGTEAKRHALRLARNIITWSKAPQPTSLRADAAEAILIGLWAVMEVGWLEQLPLEMRQIRTR